MLNNKLNPPQIKATLPAFVYEDNELTIPFELGRTVSKNQFDGIVILVRSVQTNVEKYHEATNLITYDPEKNIWKAKFIIEDSFAQIGQYYKVQIAFGSYATGDIGHYSSVGIIKCISKPDTSIENKSNGSNVYKCTGVYTNADVAEKVYSYCFNLYDNNILIASSGEQIHNNSKDNCQEFVESRDTWTIRKNLTPNKSYKIGYSVTTLNGYNTQEVYSTITVRENISPKIHASLSAINKPDDGYIEISLVGNKDDARVTGSFVLLRSSSENDFDTWDDLGNFELFNWNANTVKFIHRDYAVQQGQYYKYAIQAYNENEIYSRKILNKEGSVFCDFEDIFLSDGDRQLKIRFNPKVSTFKPTILESKTDTIGSKYPFIFRNGIVGYKEFQISGLLSILGDENDMFLTGLPHSESNQIMDSDFWLTATNYQREREFKLQVLEWLTNGKPKLFKSPAEGNYIVQLMNVNLAPVDALGRMLHSFNSTAYEIADYNFDNIKSYNLISAISTMQRTKIPKMQQIILTETTTIDIPSAYKASFSSTPNTWFHYTLRENQTYNTYEIDVGSTGVFNIPESVLKDSPLIQVTWVKHNSDDDDKKAIITYEYFEQFGNTNGNKIESIEVSDKAVQIIGTGTIDQKIKDYENLIEQESDTRTEVGTFSFLRIMPRPIIQIYQSEGQYYSAEFNNLIENWNPLFIYEIIDLNPIKYIDGRDPSTLIPELSYWFKLVDKDGNLISDDINLTKINRDTISTQSYFQSSDYYNIGEMYVGNGLYVDAIFENQIINYMAENDSSISDKKIAWIDAKKTYAQKVAYVGFGAFNVTEDKLLQYLNEMNQCYQEFLNSLEQKLKGDVNYAI